MSFFNTVKERLDPVILIIAFMLSVLVWVYVDERRIETKDITIDLHVTVPSGWELDKPLPDTFMVRLQGPKELMKGISFTEIKLEKSLPVPSPAVETPTGAEAAKEIDITAGEIVIDDKDIKTPPGVLVVSKSIEKISYSLRRLVPDYIHVVPKVLGTPAKGYRVLRSDVDPYYVDLMIPKGLLRPGDTLESYPVDISGRSEDVYRRVGIKPKVIDGRTIRTDKSVDVSVIIEPIPQIRKLEKVPVRVLYGPVLAYRIVKIAPSTITLTVEGQKLAVDNLTEQDPMVYVNFQDITGEPRGEHKIRLRVKLPSGITTRSIEPEEVVVSIK
jgi:hypothetical protein